jgi:hypothetical protein
MTLLTKEILFSMARKKSNVLPRMKPAYAPAPATPPPKPKKKRATRKRKPTAIKKVVKKLKM